MRLLRLAGLAPLLALAACGGDSPGDEPYQGAERPGANSPASFGPDFAEIELGPRLAGSEFEAKFTGPDGSEAGTLSGFVACQPELASCDEAGEEAVYTYVLEVTAKDRSSAFRTAERAYGFTGVAGYDKAEARAAIPGDSRLVTLCQDGILVWAIEGGGWSGKPITVYWQSDAAPDGTIGAYVLVTDGRRTTAAAPFPAEGSTDKCA